MPDPNADTREALTAAYAAARYRIDCAGVSVVRRIGLLDGDADARMAIAGCTMGWQILTPCNPQSMPLPDSENRQRLSDLRHQLQHRHWRFLDAVSSDPSGQWREPGFCIFDRDPCEVLTLAREYGQHAIVGAHLDEAPRLIWVPAQTR